MKKYLVLPYALLFLGIISCGRVEQRPPNIIFIMSDDHACQAISAYGSDMISTPALDRLAAEGYLFRNSFVTNSICAPSRAVLLTGTHSHINGQIDNSVIFDGSQVTFPKLLQESGYQTALVGKWHLKSDPTGFDYWNILPGQGSYYNPDFIEMGKSSRHEGYVTELTTDIAIDWIESGRDSSKPFCLLLHHKAPHRTWQPDTAYLENLESKEYPLPANFFDSYEGRVAAAAQKMSIRTDDMDLLYDLKIDDGKGSVISRFGAYDHTSRMNESQKRAWDRHYRPVAEHYLEEMPAGIDLDTWKYQRYMRDYMACVQSVDDNTGRLLDYLEEKGLLENTIIIYTSDQGFYLGEHGWFDKRFMYEESMRTPLIIRPAGGREKPSEIGALVQNIDLAPTILKMAGAEVPSPMQGQSMVSLMLENNDTEWRDALYYHYYEYPDEHMVKRHYGIRTNRYKLIHFYRDIDSWELYDLETDPGEMRNLYSDNSYADIRKDLEKRLETLRILYGDTTSME